MEVPEDTYAPKSPDLSGYHSSYVPQQTPSYYDQPPRFQKSYSQPTDHPPPSPFSNQHSPYSSSHPTLKAMPRQSETEVDDDDWAPEPSTKKRGRRAKKQKDEEDFGKSAPGVDEGIEVKTKFPVARIKRIMQADEDVGKVAQVTPTAVSKALELFMISLVTKAANQARSKSSKKVTAAHLKQVVERDEQFDFLAEIISKVPDAPAPKKEDDSEEAGEGKKKRVVTRRKRKVEEED